METLISILFFSVICLILARTTLKTSYFSPLSIHLMQWIGVSLVGLIAYSSFFPLSLQSSMALIIWWSVQLLIFTTCECFVKKRQRDAGINKKSAYCRKHWRILFLASTLTVFEIYHVGSNGPYDFFLNLRLSQYLEGYSGPRFIFMNTFYPFAMASFIINLIAQNSILNIISATLFLALFAIGTVGKFAIITPALCFLVIFDFKKKIKTSKLLLSFIFIVLAMLGIHALRSKSDLFEIATMIGTYVYSPIVAFGQISPSDQFTSAGDNTFRIVNAVLFKLGITENPPVLTILDYVNVPSPTNVFSAMYPFYKDFSFYGIFFGSVFYGLAFSFFYVYARRGSFYALICYACISISLVTAFFAETLLTHISGHIKLILVTSILWRWSIRWKTIQ